MYCCLGLCSFCCCCCFSSAAIELFFSQLPAFYIFSGMNSESWCSHNYMCINIYLYRYVCVRSLHMYRKNHTHTLWLHGVKISDRHSNSGKFDSFNMCLCEFWQGAAAPLPTQPVCRQQTASNFATFNWQQLNTVIQFVW